MASDHESMVSGPVTDLRTAPGLIRSNAWFGPSRRRALARGVRPGGARDRSLREVGP